MCIRDSRDVGLAGQMQRLEELLHLLVVLLLGGDLELRRLVQRLSLIHISEPTRPY